MNLFFSKWKFSLMNWPHCTLFGCFIALAGEASCDCQFLKIFLPSGAKQHIKGSFSGLKNFTNAFDDLYNWTQKLTHSTKHRSNITPNTKLYTVIAFKLFAQAQL